MRTMTAVATAMALASFASPALAQSVSGTVTIDGTVGEKCLVTDPGATPGSNDFGGLVHLGAIDDTDGRLKSGLAVSPALNGPEVTFRVVCTTANPSVSVTSNALTNPSAPTVPTGYANTVHFDSVVTFGIAGAASHVVNTATDGTATGGGALPGRLATGPGNVTVAASNFHTPGINDVLTAGTYTGSVAITISPL